MQTNPKISLLKDIELRKEISKKIVQIYNSVLDDKFTDEEMEAFFNNQKVTENYNRCIEWEKKENHKMEILNSLKGDKKVTPSYARYGFIFMDDSNTNEANINNQKYVDILTDEKKSLELANGIGKAILKEDYTKFITNNIDDALDIYFENPEFIQVAHESSRVFSEQKAKIHPNILNLYEYNIPLFESVSLPLFAKTFYSDPMTLLLPFKKISQEDTNKMIEAAPMIMGVLNQYKDRVQEFENPNKISNRIVSMSMKTPQAYSNLNLFLDTYKPFVKMKDEGTFTKDFQLNKVFTYKNSPINMKNASIYINQGKKIEIQELKSNEKENITNALQGNIAFKQTEMNPKFEAYFTNLNNIYNDLSNTKGLFTWDSKLFKDLNKELKTITKEYTNIIKKIHKIDNNPDKEEMKFKLLGQLYLNNSSKFANIKRLSIEYGEYKRNQEANGQVLNDRSKSRMNIASRLDNFFVNNTIDENFKLENEEMVEKIVKKNIVVPEVNNLQNNDLSKQVDVNKTKTKEKTIDLE